MENTNYDLLTTLQSKLEGINAYDKRIQNAQQAGDQNCLALFQPLIQQDTQQVEQLRSTIEKLVQQGKFHSCPCTRDAASGQWARWRAISGEERRWPWGRNRRRSAREASAALRRAATLDV